MTATEPMVVLPDDVEVVNIGLPLFAESVAQQGRPVVHVDWRIPANGDLAVVGSLTRLHGVHHDAVSAANAEVFRRLDTGVPVLTTVGTVRDVAGPVLHNVIEANGPIDVMALATQGIAMGDDVHMRTQATTNLLIRNLLPHIIDHAGANGHDFGAYLSGNHLFFLNLAMAAAKRATAPPSASSSQATITGTSPRRRRSATRCTTPASGRRLRPRTSATARYSNSSVSAALLRRVHPRSRPFSVARWPTREGRPSR